MHRLIIQIDDSLLDRVMEYLRSLPGKKVKVLKEEPPKHGKEPVDFSRFHIPTLEKISDPVAWQKELRSEWN